MLLLSLKFPSVFPLSLPRPDLHILLCWKVITYESHSSNVMAVGFQCDGNWMYSGSEDGTIKIWDLRYDRRLPLSAPSPRNISALKDAN